MYPHNFFSLFPTFPKDYKVFVAMSFDACFDKRWSEVIIPGIRKIKVDGIELDPYRVDVSKVSDSILTEILVGINNCRLFFADLTTIGKVAGKAIRNGNVMYEIGIAHAVRLPEEVILFKSDDDNLPFDVANVRVNKYEPDSSPDAAKELVTDAIIGAFKTMDLQKHLVVKRVVNSLDYHAIQFIYEAYELGGEISPPVIRTMRDALGKAAKTQAISRLLEQGVLSTTHIQLTSDIITSQKDLPAEAMIKYKITHFGKEVLAEMISCLLPSEPKKREEILKIMKEEFKSKDDIK